MIVGVRVAPSVGVDVKVASSVLVGVDVKVSGGVGDGDGDGDGDGVRVAVGVGGFGFCVWIDNHPPKIKASKTIAQELLKQSKQKDPRYEAIWNRKFEPKHLPELLGELK